MFARSTTITGDPGAIEEGIAYVRDEVLPAVTRMPGCCGMSLVVDRDSGRCIATSSWASQEAMTASDDLLAPRRARAREILGGRPTIEEWEVGLMHREHASREGATCRIMWATTSAPKAALEAFRVHVLPSIVHEEFCSVSMFLDRASGRMCATVTFDSRAALEETRERSEEDLARLADLVDVKFDEVAEFDLVLAHLRVPEVV